MAIYEEYEDELWSEWDQQDYYNFYKDKDKGKLLEDLKFFQEGMERHEDMLKNRKELDSSDEEIDSTQGSLDWFEKHYYAIKKVLEGDSGSDGPAF